VAEKSWTRNPNVVARRIGGDTILVPIGRDIAEQRCLFTLNDTGSFIWEKLASSCTFSQIHSALVEEFDVPQEKAEADLRRFLEEFAQAGCIKEDGA
jgi:hypothetical protein